MNYTYLHYETALGLLKGVGPIRARKLLQNISSYDQLFFEDATTLSKITPYPKSFFEKMDRVNALEKSKIVVDYHAKHNIQSLFYTSSDFPQQLNQCLDAPIQLFKSGNVSLNNKKFVAVVGTRSATHYGQNISKQLVQSFMGKDIVVVSGLAYGIDAWVHHYCLEYDVPTIAVLGHGLDRIYPSKHKKLAQEMLNMGGLISEFVPGTLPDRENFPKRNRIVAGMTNATIVVESKESGGSLITARLANDYNRDVFAFPGSINSETSRGCNQLIASNQAQILQDPHSFIEEMGWEKSTNANKVKQTTVFPTLSELQKTIFKSINDFRGIQIDLLSAKLNIPISKLNVELFSMELEGAIKCLPGNRYAPN